MLTIEVRGNGRTRGRAHGEALRAMIHEHLDRWKEAFCADVQGEPDAYVDEFLADTDFIPSAERWTPDLLEEVRGICEGAGTDWRYALVRQFSDEEPWYRRARKLGAWPGRAAIAPRDPDGGLYGGAKPEKGCSSIGLDARSDQPTMIAQNMDTPIWYDGHQVLMRTCDTQTNITALVLTVAGKISLCGMSDRGLGITCNTLSQLDYNPRGLAEDFVVRGYLSQPTPAAGLDFLRRLPHASGQNYTVPGQDGRALNLECSRGGVVFWRPWEGADRVFHTNHPLESRDDAIYQAQMAHLTPQQRARLTTETSQTRFAELRRRMGDPAAAPTAQDIKTALASRAGPICRDGEHEGRRDGFTLASVLMHLGAEPFLEIAPGPPHRVAYEQHGFG